MRSKHRWTSREKEKKKPICSLPSCDVDLFINQPLKMLRLFLGDIIVNISTDPSKRQHWPAQGTSQKKEWQRIKIYWFERINESKYVHITKHLYIRKMLCNLCLVSDKLGNKRQWSLTGVLFTGLFHLIPVLVVGVFFAEPILLKLVSSIRYDILL